MSTSQQADPMIGRLVDGRYRVRARIARGGMATVYVATDLRLERRVALKVMHGHLSDDAVFQNRFIQEARAAARLADPHVVNVFDQGQDDGLGYMVMEYLPGITLRELLREQRRLTVQQAVTIMDAVLSGLAAAHRAGIVHRDVKPENVLLAEDGRIKIGDFGLARATTANTATGQMLLGTIAYLAPELVTRGTADARSDIYSLGIMLYEMLVGEQPYQGEQPMQIAFQHATDSVPRPSAKNPGVPEPLDELVLWATEKVPDERPVDAQQMLDRLREIERELGISRLTAAAVTAGIATIDDASSSGDLTKVIPGALTGPTAAVGTVDNATSLRRRAKRRSTRGAWLLALVLLLAGLAAGLGWWFGSGPGSLVPVPSVAGMTFDAAKAALAKQSLTATQEDVFDLDAPIGEAVGTDPPEGSRVDKDSEVTVLISKGPQPHDIEPLAGKTAAAARGILEDGANLVVAPDVEVFAAEPADTVITATLTRRADETQTLDCTKGCAGALEGDTMTLVVSLGPLPAVAGKSVDEATALLTGVGLEVSPDKPEEFSDDIDAGVVIRMGDRPNPGAWRVGDTATLIVSKGPQPIAVPQVIGKTIRDAISTINGVGLTGHSDLPEVFWDIYKVTSIDPGEGTLQPPGRTITITGFTL